MWCLAAASRQSPGECSGKIHRGCSLRSRSPSVNSSSIRCSIWRREFLTHRAPPASRGWHRWKTRIQDANVVPRKKSRRRGIPFHRSGDPSDRALKPGQRRADRFRSRFCGDSVGVGPVMMRTATKKMSGGVVLMQVELKNVTMVNEPYLLTNAKGRCPHGQNGGEEIVLAARSKSRSK